jgi:uncharacterized protein YqfA (UPF0365 family)
MIVPDMGEIDFDISAFNADPAAAAALVAERAAQVQALMVEGESSATLRDMRKELRAAEATTPSAARSTSWCATSPIGVR